jgi:hypothetical protein
MFSPMKTTLNKNKATCVGYRSVSHTEHVQKYFLEDSVKADVLYL